MTWAASIDHPNVRFWCAVGAGASAAGLGWFTMGSPSLTDPRGVGGLALLGFAGVVVAVLVQSLFRLSRGPRLTASHCIELANDAAATERWELALEWTRKARKLGASRTETLADEGEFLLCMGRYEEAYAVLSEAGLLDQKEGYVDFRAAQAAVAAGHPDHDVLVLLDRSLWKSPELAGDVEAEPSFLPLMNDPRFARLVSAAYARLGDERGGRNL